MANMNREDEESAKRIAAHIVERAFACAPLGSITSLVVNVNIARGKATINAGQLLEPEPKEPFDWSKARPGSILAQGAVKENKKYAGWHAAAPPEGEQTHGWWMTDGIWHKVP